MNSTILSDTMIWYTNTSEKITIVKRSTVSSAHMVAISFVMRAPEMYSLSEFPVFSTVLLTEVTMLCTRSPELA